MVRPCDWTCLKHGSLVVFTFLTEKEGVAQLTPMLNLPRFLLIYTLNTFSNWSLNIKWNNFRMIELINKKNVSNIEAQFIICLLVYVLINECYASTCFDVDF